MVVAGGAAQSKSDPGPTFPEELQRRAAARVSAALAQHADERVRAVQLVYEGFADESIVMERLKAQETRCLASSAASQVHQACEPESLGSAASQATPASVFSTGAERLAHMAVSTRDPFVYGLAFRRCENPVVAAGAPSCGQLSLGQWTRLDPSDATPWLWTIERARQRHEHALVVEALHRLSMARAIRQDGFAAAALVMDTLPADLSPEERTVAQLQASELALKDVLPPFNAVVAECSGRALRDGNRAQVCERIAALLVQPDGLALAVLTGAAMGERLGWPPQRVAQTRAEVDAVLRASGRWIAGSDTAAAGPCEQVRRLRDWTLMVRDKGEMGAAREAVRRAGAEPRQLVDAYLAERASRRPAPVASGP